MIQGCENPQAQPTARPALRIGYAATDVPAALAQVGTLAVIDFSADQARTHDPRYLRVALDSQNPAPPLELWQVDASVSSGSSGALRWSSGGGWLFCAIELDEREHGGTSATAQLAYEQLHAFVANSEARHVLRVWNYLGAINQGEGDAERYKHFCDGRAIGMGNFFEDGFPAATAIGHLGAPYRLQVYLLACDQAGTRVENPRQLSAWRYPRQYGRTPPSFARAMTLPAHDALAISGTAAVVGHASTHEDDLEAQLEETMLNLDALLASAGMQPGFDASSPLKAYVRHAADVMHVQQFFEQRLPGVPMLLLQGDICRSELLVEIDGWRYASA